MDVLCEESMSMHSDYSNLSFENVPYPKNKTIWMPLDYTDGVKIFAYVVVIVGGLLGNVSAILTVSLNRSMRTTINFYIANLAVADAMICIICMLPHALTIMTNQYVLGDFMCKFNPFTQMACLTSSVLTLSAISCDRFMAIMYPLHVRVTKRRTSVVMTIVWITSLAVSIPFLIVKKLTVIQWKDFVELKCMEVWPVVKQFDKELGWCVSDMPLRAFYYMVVSMTLFIFPMLIMLTAYSLILWRLSSTQVPGEQHAANLNAHARSRKKVTRMVFVVLIVFVICWTPMQAMVLYSAFGHNVAKHGHMPAWFSEFEWFSYFLAYSNSFMNPIIYGGFNKTFREGFCMVLRCGFCRDTYGRPGSNAIVKSFRSVNTSLSSLRSRTLKLFSKPHSEAPPTNQAQLGQPTAV